MLSDEEKKAIDKLKRSANYFVMPMYETKIILNLIEKQSKEIEELKETNEEMGKALDEWNNGERTSIFHIHKDKIKAKIEFIKSLKEKIYYEENVISILQSLLEKE